MIIYIGLYILIMGVFIHFILEEFLIYDHILIFGIIVPTIILYVLLCLLVPANLPKSFATDFLGANFMIDIVLCTTPSIVIIGTIAIIINLIHRLKKRRR